MIELFSAGIPATYLGILFFFICLGSFGFPGGTVWMLAFGALASTIPELLLVMLVVASAAMLGDITAYEIARKFSLVLTKQLMRIKFYRQNITRTNELFERSAFAAVFITRFLLLALGAVVSYLAGFQRMDRKRYVTAVVSGETLYGIIYPAIGFAFKETWNDVYNVLNNATLVLVFLVLAVLLIRFVRKRRAETLQRA